MKEYKYSPSINIKRDNQKFIHYIPTSNSIRVYSQITENYRNSNFRSFNLVGSYGTGKSAFLLAFINHITGRQKIFGIDDNGFKNIIDFEIMDFVGDYSSFLNAFAKRFKIKGNYSPFEVIHSLEEHYFQKHNNSYCLIIVADEFGKHLEYAAGNEPEKEMYFIQLLAEYVNDESKNILFLTTLHQNIDAYGAGLSTLQRQEWNKVRGRLKEIPFVEPVEQLLSLAAEHISKNKPGNKLPDNFNSLFESVMRTKLFPLKSGLEIELAKNLYPMDILSSAVLTLALQKYGQNERSLFSFLLTNDYLGINDYDFTANDYYGLSAVYDYLLNNYYSFLFTKYNPHYTQWAAIRTAIERAEGFFDRDISDYCRLIKTVGLLNIFSPESSVLDEDFLREYGRLALGIKNIDEVIQQLVNKKIIKYVLYKRKFILFEGSDLDIELALKEAGEKIDKGFSIVSLIEEFFEFPYLAANRIYYEKGTPRFFEFVLSEQPVENYNKRHVDGLINCIFSQSFKNTISAIQSTVNNEAILYGVYNNTDKIKSLLFEILKIKHTVESVEDDFVAKRELSNLLAYNKNILNTYIFDSFYDGTVIWLFNGKRIAIRNSYELKKQLSSIIESIYYNAPVFINELVNRNKISASITSARRNFLKALLNCWDKPGLNITTEKYPPEKMIYKTLLEETGIHKMNNQRWTLNGPDENNSFIHLWEESLKFIESAKYRKRPVSDIIKILSQKPYGLKNGVIEFWVPLFLFCQRDNYALYLGDKYIQTLNEELLEIIIKSPEKVELKAFNVEGIKFELFQKYQSLIKRGEQEISNQSFISTIRPFLIFYKQLPEYTKKTNNLKPHTKKFREAIAKAKDPEKTFFTDIPEALGFVDLDLINNEAALQKYIDTVQESINELKFSYDNLINQFEEIILNALGYENKNESFKKVFEKIKGRYKSVNTAKSTAFQRNLLKRFETAYETKLDWISSMVHAVMDRPLAELSDDEALIAGERLKEALIELEDLIDVSKAGESGDLASVIKVTVLSQGRASASKVVGLTKEKEMKIKEKIAVIRQHLSKDKNENIELLACLLEDELNK